MRSSVSMVALLASATLLAGCDGLFSPDNFDEPGSRVSGQITYQGEPVQVASDQVQFNFWQPGPEFELEENIDVYVDQDGSFSAMLFDGDYEYQLINGQGPWVDNDSRMPFQVRGSTSLEIQVTPYYTVQSASFSNNADVVQATFTIGQVDTSRDVEFVGLYVSTTVFVDRSNQIVRSEMDGGDIPDLGGTISLSVELPDDIRVQAGPEPRTAVYARVGIKTAGEADMIFSPVQEVGL